MINQLEPLEADKIIAAYLQLNNVKTPEGQTTARSLYEFLMDNIPRGCDQCDELYAICSSRPRCNLIPRDKHEDNLCLNGVPNAHCPYAHVREFLVKYK